MSGDVMIAAGPHKASNTAAVLDPVAKTVIESARLADSQEGYRRLIGFAARWDRRRWAVEGCHGAGRSLAQRLAAGGEAVPGRAGQAGRPGPGVLPGPWPHGRQGRRGPRSGWPPSTAPALSPSPATVRWSACGCCGRREELTAQRTQAVCRLHRLLAELTPGGMRGELTASKAQALLARIRPADEVARVRVHIARDHLADIRALDARIKYIGGQIAALVTTSGTTLTLLFGAGPVIAGRILAEAGEVARSGHGQVRQLQRHRADRRLLRRTDAAPAVAGW